MTDATLEGFRQIATTMHPEPHDWQWIGPHMSQRMFGITQAKAEAFAARHGGSAKPMQSEAVRENSVIVPATSCTCTSVN